MYSNSDIIRHTFGSMAKLPKSLLTGKAVHTTKAVYPSGKRVDEEVTFFLVERAIVGTFDGASTTVYEQNRA